jgi:hypothetical protein
MKPVKLVPPSPSPFPVHPTKKKEEREKRSE